MGREGQRYALSSFSHTSNATYLASFFALCCVGYDSTHVSVDTLVHLRVLQSGRQEGVVWWVLPRAAVQLAAAAGRHPCVWALCCYWLCP